MASNRVSIKFNPLITTTMKKSIEQKKQETDELFEQVATQIAGWQRKAPAKRKAVFILADCEIEQYCMGYAVNKHSKHQVADAAAAFIGPMRDEEQFLFGMDACVRYIRREKNKAAKAAQTAKAE